MSASIHALPEALLGEILALCGLREGRSVTLVCRPWRHLFYQQRGLWCSLEVQLPLGMEQHTGAAEACAIKLAVVQRVAPLVEDAYLGGHRFDTTGQLGGTAGRLPELLGALQAATALTRLHLEHPSLSRQAAAALAALSSLRQLRRGGGFGRHDAAALPALSQLQALTVQHRALHSFVPVVPRLSPALTSLTLHCTSSVQPMPPLRCLTSLSQLRELEIVEDVMPLGVGGLELLPISAFPAISRLALCSGAHLRTAEGALFRGVPHPSRPAIVQLRRRPPPEPPAWLLLCAYVVLSEGADLPALLGALAVQPGQLARLLLRRAVLPGRRAVAAWPQLPGLTRLICDSTRLPLDALLPRLPHLQVMNLTGGLAPDDGPALLAPLAHCAAGLHTLQLQACGAAQLPHGPYLQGLRTLVLEDCPLAALPPCFAAASQLEELSLLGNEDLVIHPQDVDSILARLPALRLLRLEGHQLALGAAARLQALAALLPQLQLEVRQEVEDKDPRPGPS